jgi:hypothetical protein
VRLRPTLFVVFLLYVVLDLCVPVVGGAFVFEASESAEGIRMARLWVAPTPAVAPRLPDVGTDEREGLRHPLAAPPAEPPLRFRLVHHRPRAALSSPPSPDAH